MTNYNYTELLKIISPFLPVDAATDFETLLNRFDEIQNLHKYDLEVIDLQQRQLQIVREKLRLELERKNDSVKVMISTKEELVTLKKVNNSLEICNEDLSKQLILERKTATSMQEQMQTQIDINKKISKESKDRSIHNKQLLKTVSNLSDQITAQEQKRKVIVRKNNEKESEIEDFNMQIVSLEQALLQFKNENIELEEQAKVAYKKGYQEGYQEGEQFGQQRS